MIYREPLKLIVQIEDSLLGQLLYYWSYYGKPCRLLFRPAKAENLTAVCLDMNNPEAAAREAMRIREIFKQSKAG